MSARPVGPILDIGCGDRKVPGAVGLDVTPGPGVDIVHDITRAPWPVDDGAFAEVHAHQVLEHLPPPSGRVDPLFTVMREAHRALSPGGRFILDVPHVGSRHAVGVPTHYRLFNEHTFEFFAPGRRTCDSLPIFRSVVVSVDREIGNTRLGDYHLKTYLPGVYRLVCRAGIGRPRNVYVRLTK